MIKVLLNGTPVYKLCFARKQYSKLKNGQPLFETSAIIYLVDAKRDEPPVAQASVRQHHKDKYNPENARHAALKVLLRNEHWMGKDITTAVPFNRLERTAIWQAYWKRPKGQPDAPKTPLLPPIAPAQGGTPARTNKVDAGRPVARKQPSVAKRLMPELPAAPEGHKVVNFPVLPRVKRQNIAWVNDESGQVH